MFQPPTTDNVTTACSVLHFIKHFQVHETKFFSCYQMFTGRTKRRRQSQAAHGMPTAALENRYGYTTCCDKLVGCVLFTGSNTLVKLTETTYVMWPIRIIVVEAFCCIFGARWSFRIYDICKRKNYIMSNDTGNDQNLFQMKITEDRVAKLWHYVVKLHVQGYTEHHKTNENFSSKISAPVSTPKEGACTVTKYTTLVLQNYAKIRHRPTGAMLHFPLDMLNISLLGLRSSGRQHYVVW